MNRFPLSAVCCALLFSGAAQASGTAELKAFVADTHSARADFTQTVFGKSGVRPQRSAGSLAFARPGKFRWIYERPYYQLIVGDGEKIWVYDRDLQQVTVRNLGQALGDSPAALLSGDNKALEQHFVLADAGSADGLEWVEATPKVKEGSFKRVRLGLKDDLPRVMEVVDDFGRTTTLAFSHFERNPALPSGLFRFVPPKGADVIGE